jgi:excisionase family DNA binding protein
VNSQRSRPYRPRLLSPVEAAAYLGLPSRFAVYRLVSSGRLPAVRLANKIRLDLCDLDALIEAAKGGTAVLERPTVSGPRGGRLSVPRQLAPLRRRRRSVTAPVTAAKRDA